jgi:ABC-2 type transport system permease protein
MRNIAVIARRELYAYFGSPLAYVVMAFFLAVQGFLFQLFLVYANQGMYGIEMGSILGSGWFYFFLILYTSIITMRLLAEEQRSGTLEIVLTAPVRDWELVVGKYLASLALFVLTTIIGLVQVAILAWVGDPGPGVTFSAYLGYLLVGAALLAIGTFASTLTSSQPAAAIVSIVIGVVLWLIQFASPMLRDTFWGQVVERVAFFSHYEDFASGLVSSTHIVYYVSLVAAGLFLATQALQARRWR